MITIIILYTIWKICQETNKKRVKNVDIYIVTCYNCNRNKCNNYVTNYKKFVTEEFMKAKFVRRGIIIAAFASAVLISGQEAKAADIKPLAPVIKQELNSENNVKSLTSVLAEVKKEAIVTEMIKIKSAQEMRFELLFNNKGIARTSEEYILVYTQADQASEWTGKIFDMSLVDIISEEKGFVYIQSGDVVGYVKAGNLIVKTDAIEFAKTVLVQEYPEQDIFALSEEAIFESFSVGETREEEEARIAAEEEARKAAEKARIQAEKEAKLQKGKNVIKYAKKFIGNPYVYGGSSLTRGTDCSGYVKSVYAHFGVYLPRTSYSMRSVGKAVKYNDMQPGDIVCYSGHVALYAGNGMIVHAANEKDDITMSSVNYARIITIRRMF